ncbi:MAG: ATP-binding cassette domain-containing protein [Synergistaceae bacterium]|nr:ATP-binding cassette domain-containing protein [Synergistaceae bacterium]
MSDEIFLRVRNLKKHFPVREGFLRLRPRRTRSSVKAVDDVTFSIAEGETLGLVGESGCGKSTTGKVLLRLLPATSGSVFFRGSELLSLKGEELRKARQGFQMIFQDPYASLDPRMTVGRIVEEPLRAHGVKSAPERLERVAEMLEAVGLDTSYLRRYAFEFSGGQRQRIGIARALILRPSLIVADEPVSALDVSVQAQVINLLMEMRSRFKLTYLFIAHDLSVVRHISDRVAVMYLGRIVEIGKKDDFFERPLHPYTHALLASVPEPDPLRERTRFILSGDVPSPLNPPEGCAFHPRCPRAAEPCSNRLPELRDMGGGHWVACHLYETAQTKII